MLPAKSSDRTLLSIKPYWMGLTDRHLVVISQAPLVHGSDGASSYAPYVREMDMWMEQVSSTTFYSPVSDEVNLSQPFQYQTKISHLHAIAWNFTTIVEAMRTIVSLPSDIMNLNKVMRQADHIHLRAPSSSMILAILVCWLFPNTPSSCKYAGNWDPAASQPLSYQIIKYLLGLRWSRHIKVMAYGQWRNQSENIFPFFTATYSAHDVARLSIQEEKSYDRAVFVGTLGDNKRPALVINVVAQLAEHGQQMKVDFYGDGPQRERLEALAAGLGVGHLCTFMGNRTLDDLARAYQRAGFVFLLSQSEGWPKAVAEGMFWGAIPIATPVSCVPWMLGDGQRGILVKPDATLVAAEILVAMTDHRRLVFMSREGQRWSRNYTTERFREAIGELLQVDA